MLCAACLMLYANYCMIAEIVCSLYKAGLCFVIVRALVQAPKEFPMQAVEIQNCMSTYTILSILLCALLPRRKTLYSCIYCTMLDNACTVPQYAYVTLHYTMPLCTVASNAISICSRLWFWYCA